jgi:hypothetical protein
VGTSKSIEQFVGKINKVGHATDRARLGIVNDGALATKKIMLAAAAAKGVQPGGTIAGRKWNVSYATKGGELPTALVRFTGPFHLVNNDTVPHYIAASGLGGSRTARGDRAFLASATRFSGGSTAGVFGGQRRRKGARALKTPYGTRAYLRHPGTDGKNIYQGARVIAGVTVPPRMAKAMSNTWKQVFR